MANVTNAQLTAIELQQEQMCMECLHKVHSIGSWVRRGVRRFYPFAEVALFCSCMMRCSRASDRAAKQGTCPI